MTTDTDRFQKSSPTGCDTQLAVHQHSISFSFAWWQDRFDATRVNTRTA